jgi:eukaryotic-like serine/threonine-protein kinase
MEDLSETVANTRKAYELRNRVSDREKLYITSRYEQNVTGNLESARQTLELWAQTYPRDEIPSVSLGFIYACLGEYDRFLAVARKAVELNPGSGLAYGNLVWAYLTVNRLDEASYTAREAISHHLDSDPIHFITYAVAFLQQDAAAMEREAAMLMGKPGYDHVMFYTESDTAAYAAQFAKARELTRNAIASAERAHEKAVAATYQAAAAVRETLIGNMILAQRQAHAALALSNSRDVEALSAIAFASTGNSAEATRLSNDLAKRFPKDTVVQFNYLPSIQAAVALERASPRDADKAIQALATAAVYELGQTARVLSFAAYPVYFRGEAYLAAHRGAAAAAEFQKILEHSGVVLNEPIGSLARLGLARAYALAGDTPKSRTAYQDFFALWKGADTNIPILKEAKAEYSKLI